MFIVFLCRLIKLVFVTICTPHLQRGITKPCPFVSRAVSAVQSCLTCPFAFHESEWAVVLFPCNPCLFFFSPLLPHCTDYCNSQTNQRLKSCKTSCNGMNILTIQHGMELETLYAICKFHWILCFNWNSTFGRCSFIGYIKFTFLLSYHKLDCKYDNIWGASHPHGLTALISLEAGHSPATSRTWEDCLLTIST